MMITVHRSDPQFQAYLRGTFSSEERALPVRTLSGSSESVTFDIRPIASCREGLQHSPFKVWMAAIRPWSLILSLGPMLLTVLACRSLWRNWGLTTLSVLSVVGLQVAGNLLNDYFDHMAGVDRLNPRSGTRVIQRGWLAAYQVVRAAYGLIGLSIIVAFPVLLRNLPLAAVALLTGLMILKYNSSQVEFKYRLTGEMILFLLFGPLLTVSLTLVGAGQWLEGSVWVGVWSGLSAAHIYFLRNLENVMLDEQSGRRTWAAWAGFDRSKKLAMGFGLARWLALLGLVLFLKAGAQALILLACEGIYQLHLGWRLKKSSSPLSSAMRGVHHQAWRSYGVMTALLGLLAVSGWLRGA